MNVSLEIIIVNWNSGHFLHDCLRSIATAEKDSIGLLRVVVVDNASTDNSLGEAGDFPLSLTTIRNSKNGGFAAACNQGAKGSQADYLLFLNPDVRLFENSLTKPLAFLEQPDNRKIGILGIQLVDERGNVSRRVCARFPSARNFFIKMFGMDRLFPKTCEQIVLSEWGHFDSRVVDNTTGAFFLVRRHLFEELGGFDQRFFVYLEDLDFSLRARRAGWTDFYLAEAQAFHKEHGSSEKAKAARVFHWLRSRILYGYKHFSWWLATALLLSTLFVEPIARLGLALYHRSVREALATLEAVSRLWVSVPSMLAEARCRNHSRHVVRVSPK